MLQQTYPSKWEKDTVIGLKIAGMGYVSGPPPGSLVNYEGATQN